MKYICLDTETTGFSLKNDKIIELCCIDISDDSVYQTYINPEIKIPEIPIEKKEEKIIKMDEEYYTKLGVNILRSKKMGDDFDIFETK